MIIALNGKIKSGKTTVADILVEKYGFVKLSFATPLKDIVKIVYNIDDKYFTPFGKNIKIEHLGVSVRQLLQVVGTELFREQIHKYLPDLKIPYGFTWYNHMKERIHQEIQKGNFNIVIDDLRFPNEFQLFIDFHAVLIYMKRKESFNTKHKSSQIYKRKSDFIINNNYSLDILEFSIKNILEKLNFERC